MRMQFSRVASAIVGIAAVAGYSAGAEAQGFRREGRIEAREARQEGRYDARNFGNYGGYAPGGVYYGPYYGPSYSSGYYGYNGPQYHGPAYGSYATNPPPYYAPPARYDDNVVYHGHERAVLGVTLGENRDGVVTVQQITPDSPAEEAGLRRGDEILAINGRQVFSYRDVTRMIADHQPNDLVELSIGRNGRERTVEATLAGREVPNRPLTSVPGNYPVAPGGYYSPRQARRARNAAIDPGLYSEPYAY